MRDIMMDLETWGKKPGCALRSIGARQFDPYSDRIGESFYANITKESCLEAGLVLDASTEKWWSDQGAQAQDILLKDQKPLRDVLEDYCHWFEKLGGMFTWSQGANFDQPIVEAACDAVGIGERDRPWKFWDSRCTRTAYGIASFNPRTIRRKGIHHYALDDCNHQIICVQRSFRALRLSTIKEEML